MLREVGEELFKGCSMLDVPGNTKNTPLFMDKLFGNVAGLKGTGKSTHRDFIFIFAGESQKLQKKREREKGRAEERKSVCCCRERMDMRCKAQYEFYGAGVSGHGQG